MNGTNGNQPGYPENALVPYPVIVAATKGDPDAMKMVLQHFSGYIARLSMRKLYDERGNVYFGIDNDIRERLQAKLMMAVLNFRTEKLDNRNQVKIKKISMIFHGFYCTLKIPEEKALFFRVV